MFHTTQPADTISDLFLDVRIVGVTLSLYTDVRFEISSVLSPESFLAHGKRDQCANALRRCSVATTRPCRMSVVEALKLLSSCFLPGLWFGTETEEKRRTWLLHSTVSSKSV